MAARAKECQPLRDEYSQRPAVQLNERQNNISGSVLEQLRAIQIEHQLYREGKIRRKDRLYSTRDLKKCAEAVLSLVQAALVGISNLEKLIKKGL